MSSLKNSIAVLSATKPPGKRWRYVSAGPGNARIAELENQLGIEPSGKLFRLSAMNERIEELETQRAAKSSTPPPAASAPVAPVELSTATLRELGTLVFGAGAPDDPETLSRHFYAANLRVPGLSFAKLESESAFRFPNTGLAGATRAARQSTIDRFFKTKK